MPTIAPRLGWPGRIALYALALGGGAATAFFGLPDELVGMPDAHAAELSANAAPAPPVHVLEMGHVDAPVRPPDDPDPTGRAFASGRVISGATPHRLLLFTFDDGPDLRTTPVLLDVLDEAGIKALFFVTTGRFDQPMPWYQKNAELVREIARRGHLIGNHTRSHAELPALDDVGVGRELDDAAATIEQTLGARPYLMRPPGGSRSARVDSLIASRGYTQMLWNLGAGDFQVSTSDEVVRTFIRVLERREREEGKVGGIVLLHDTHLHTVEAFPRMLDYLRERNCALYAEGEELFDIVDDPSFFFAPRGNANSSAAAPAAEPSVDVLALRQRRLREEAARRCEPTDAR